MQDLMTANDISDYGHTSSQFPTITNHESKILECAAETGTARYTQGRRTWYGKVWRLLYLDSVVNTLSYSLVLVAWRHGCYSSLLPI
jgi:hypothetical protein